MRRVRLLRQVRPLRGAATVVSAALLGVTAVGCSGSGGARPAATGRGTTASPHGAVAVRGPWRTWTRKLTDQEASGVCGATPNQVVCSIGSDGLVGRSRADGTVTWTVPASGSGKNGGLLVDAADERAVTSGGRTLRAANLRTGTAAWSHRLPAGRTYTGFVAADGIVYALDTRVFQHTLSVALGAFRASDGTALWHKPVDMRYRENVVAFGGRVYGTDGARVTARDARTGRTLATSPPGITCPHLIAGGHYLVCTGDPKSNRDLYPPIRRLDPTGLRLLSTTKSTGMVPERGLISADGILMLYEVSPEDPSGGPWTAYDLDHHRELWSDPPAQSEAGLVDGRFVSFTNPADDVPKERLISIDLHAGPDATGAAAPRVSPASRDDGYSAYSTIVLPGGDSGYAVIQTTARTTSTPRQTLRSMPLP